MSVSNKENLNNKITNDGVPELHRNKLNNNTNNNKKPRSRSKNKNKDKHRSAMNDDKLKNLQGTKHHGRKLRSISSSQSSSSSSSSSLRFSSTSSSSSSISST